MDPPADSAAAIDACSSEVVVLNLRSPGCSRVLSAATHGSAPQPGASDCARGNDYVADEPCHSEAVLDAWNLRLDQWRVLASRGPHRIRARKSLLLEQSSYFQSLFSDHFRESTSHSVNVVWDVAISTAILQLLHCGQLDISTENVLHFLESAIFFGIDNVLRAIESWATLVMLSPLTAADDELLQLIPVIWNYAKEVGASALLDICVGGFSANFMAGMSLEGSENLPPAFLLGCLDHPQLTVCSERELCETLMKWCAGQAEVRNWVEARSPSSHKYLSCLKKIRISLLPLDYLCGNILGRFHLNLFDLSDFTTSTSWDREGDKDKNKRAFDLLHSLDKSINDHTKYSLRLTLYLEVLDLSGCQQVTCAHLFSSAASSPSLANQVLAVPTYPVSPFENNLHRVGSLKGSHRSSYFSERGRNVWPTIPCFRRLRKVFFSDCWRLNEEDLASWLGAACPAIQELRVVNCPHIRFSLLSSLALPCPLIQVAEFSSDISCLVKQKLHVERCVREDTPFSTIGSPERVAWLSCLLEHLTELYLQGHRDLTDYGLADVARSCPSLVQVNLSGCTALSDLGISQFLRGYSRLHGLRSACTKFGTNSVSSLHRIFKHGELLDLENCHGVQDADLGKLLGIAPLLKKLFLGNTTLTDYALSLFAGRDLELLDVHETYVSGPSLARVIIVNPLLRSLNTRGCRRIGNVMSSKSLGEPPPSSVFGMLGCQGVHLEELKAGWGFSDLALGVTRYGLCSIKRLELGVGASFSIELVPELSRLEHLSLTSQVISDASMSKMFEQAENLQRLELCNCIGYLSATCIQQLALKCGQNLTSLKLERVAPSLTDHDISVLSSSCKGLRHFAITGCRALTSEALKLIGDKLRGLVTLKLEECGQATIAGASHLLKSCRALQELHLRHNGKGLPANFVMEAAAHLRLLRFLALDHCDAKDHGFQLPRGGHDGLLATLLLAQCKPFQVQGVAATMCHRKTVVYEWNKFGQVSTTVKERL